MDWMLAFLIGVAVGAAGACTVSYLLRRLRAANDARQIDHILSEPNQRPIGR